MGATVPSGPVRWRRAVMAAPRSAVLSALVVLAGCSAAPDGSSGEAPPGSFAAYQVQKAALAARWGGVAATLPSDLPHAGSARYSGVMSLRLESAGGDLPVHGALTLDVAFASSSLTGVAQGFVGQGGTSYSGSLSISNGVIDRTADPSVSYSFSANMGGTLSGGGDSFAISADLNGDFLGPSHGGVTGPVAGSAVSSFGTGYLFGDFIAAR